jgi:hypothetical protein
MKKICGGFRFHFSDLGSKMAAGARAFDIAAWLYPLARGFDMKNINLPLLWLEESKRGVTALGRL